MIVPASFCKPGQHALQTNTAERYAPDTGRPHCNARWRRRVGTMHMPCALYRHFDKMLERRAPRSGALQEGPLRQLRTSYEAGTRRVGRE